MFGTAPLLRTESMTQAMSGFHYSLYLTGLYRFYLSWCFAWGRLNSQSTWEIPKPCLSLLVTPDPGMRGRRESWLLPCCSFVLPPLWRGMERRHATPDSTGTSLSTCGQPSQSQAPPWSHGSLHRRKTALCHVAPRKLNQVLLWLHSVCVCV